MSSLLAKTKVLLILDDNSLKIEIKLFPLCAIFKLKLELLSDILWVIVGFTFWNNFLSQVAILLWHLGIHGATVIIF